MKQDVLKQAALFSKEHRRRTRRHKVFSVLAAVMVFCTTYALIMPAITLEHEALPVCGLEEHTHTEACYGEPELVCGLEETDGEGHVHTDACYETVETEREVLTCELPEGEGHVHTDACYAEPPATTGTDLICELEENEDHTHSDECYAPVEADGERVLVCGLEECEPHTHGEGCYTTEVVEEKTLTCGEEEAAAHTHTEECYERPLICGLEEHTHTEECYTEEISDGEVPEGEVPEEPFVELERTVESRYYKALFHVTYHGELAEEDVLDFTASTDEDVESSERGAEYFMAVGESTTFPTGRTEFVLTNNGEPVDRALYDVTVELIPSREMVAYLYQMSAEMMMGLPDTMDLTAEDYEDEPVLDSAEPVVDETEPVADAAEPDGHTHSEPFVGFMAYELEDGALALRGAMPVDFSAIDMETYVAGIEYDEEDNIVPDYDETYAFNIQPLEQDFMFAAGVAENPIEEMADYSQEYYDSRIEVWWDEYKTTVQEGYWGTSYEHSRVSPDHVDTVTLTRSTYAGEKLPGADGKIVSLSVNQGNSSDPMKAGGLQIGNVYGEMQQVDGIRITYKCKAPVGSHTGTVVVVPETADWEKATKAKVGDTWEENSCSNHFGTYDTVVTKIEKNVKGSMGYATLEITPDQGYYVTEVVIACVHSNHYGDYGSSRDGLCPPWDCGILKRNGTFRAEFTVATGTKASVVVPSEAYCHGNYDGGTYQRCYILVKTAAIPSPLYVQYDAGEMKDNPAFNGTAWLDGTDARHTETNNVQQSGLVDKLTKTGSNNKWAEGTEIIDGKTVKYVTDLRYTTAGITTGENSAEAAAALEGKRFAGWRIEYFNTAVEKTYGNIESVEFSDSYGQTPGTVDAKSPVDLIINARLTAVWKDIPSAEVSKEVKNLPDGENGPDTTEREFQFNLKDANGSMVDSTTFTSTVSVLELVDGKPQVVTKSVAGSNPFTIKVSGNGKEKYEICGLPNGTYTISEVNENGTDADGKSYRTSYTGQTFTIQNSSQTVTASHSVKVVNDFITGYDVTIEKVTKDIEDNEIPKSAGPEMLDDGITPNPWEALGGAKFNLYARDVEKQDGTYGWNPTPVNSHIGDDNKPVVDPIEPRTDNHPSVAKTEQRGLTYGILYKLEETVAPAGYNKLSAPIYFKAESTDRNKIILCNENGEAIDPGSKVNAETIDGVLTLIVANYGGFELPSTGGPGTYVYALGGMLLAAAAAILMYKSTRRREGGLTD